jgi:hypothetical protein
LSEEDIPLEEEEVVPQEEINVFSLGTAKESVSGYFSGKFFILNIVNVT